MDLTPNLCRAARSLLGWTAADLAQASELGVRTVRRFENLALAARRSREAMVHALEAGGIEFIAEGASSPDGGAGVRARPGPIAEPEVGVAMILAEIEPAVEAEAVGDQAEVPA